VVEDHGITPRDEGPGTRNGAYEWPCVAKTKIGQESVRNRSGIGQEGLGGLQPLLDEVLSEPEVPETVAEKEFGI